ncbi:MAG: hypothetical protein J4F28_02220 [Nitrosopumilaceae archaeon]|nr:hypothetical protein [Nitrosopumilaceae archaeon]
MAAGKTVVCKGCGYSIPTTKPTHPQDLDVEVIAVYKCVHCPEANG